MSVSRAPTADAPTQDHLLRGNLSLKQRLALAAGTSVPLELAATMDDEAFNFVFLQANGIRARNLNVAKVTPPMLKARGVSTARDLRMLDFDALHLNDAGFCAGCVAAYGADDVVREFLITPADAVATAGSPAMHQLGLDVGTLLVLCAGAPTEAAAVLVQSLPRGGALKGVAPVTLLDTGLRAHGLRELGYGPESVTEQTRCSVVDLEKLGF